MPHGLKFVVACAIANAVSLKTGDAGFYLDKQYYTPTKSEKDKKTRIRLHIFT